MAGKLSASLKGAANGLAELGSDGKVPSAQLPAATGGGVELGETNATAYRGDRGKTAYDHSQLVTGNPHGTTKADLSLDNVPNVDATNPANITQTSTYRFVSDTEKTAWDGKQAALGFTAENVANKSTSIVTDLESNTKYPSVKSVYDWTLSLGYITSSALSTYLEKNSAITAGTKTKITYDVNGLVTSATDATTADIADSTNKRYVTDANLTTIGNQSGINTGDQTTIVGITGTKAQFDTAVSDGNIMYIGDAPTAHTHPQSEITSLVSDLALKAPLDSPTFTGAVSGITKTMVGLGSVDNTSDANKPVSTATQTALNLKLDANTPITGETKTKVTYDADGLVTSGADATTADIADSSNKRYVTDAQLVVIGNTSGTNTGDNAVNSLYSGLVSNATHTGEVTGSTSLTIANDAVTFAKMQNIATAKLLGRANTGTGDIEEITLGTNLSFTGTTLNAAGGGGAGVTDGDKGDITVTGTGGTWTIDNGAVSYSKIQNVSDAGKILGRSTAGSGVVEEITVGSGLTLSGGVLTSSGGLPTQTGYANYVLTTDGTNASWGNAALVFSMTYNTATNGQYAYYSSTNGWTAFTIANFADQASASGVASGLLYSVTVGGYKQVFIKKKITHYEITF